MKDKGPFKELTEKLLEVNVGVITVSTNRVVKQDCLLCIKGQMKPPSQNELTPGKRPAGRNFTAHIDLTAHSSHDGISLGTHQQRNGDRKSPDT